MTYRGHIENGQIRLDESVQFPEGAQVVVTLVESQQPSVSDLSAVLLRHAGQGENLPSDLADQHDHYAHGKPKR
jgi:hypothetical protein